MLVNSKNSFLLLKKNIINEIREELIENIKKKININYSNYVDNLITNLITTIEETSDKPKYFDGLFNTKDYNYLLKNPKKITR